MVASLNIESITYMKPIEILIVILQSFSFVFFGLTKSSTLQIFFCAEADVFVKTIVRRCRLSLMESLHGPLFYVCNIFFKDSSLRSHKHTQYAATPEMSSMPFSEHIKMERIKSSLRG